MVRAPSPQTLACSSFRVILGLVANEELPASARKPGVTFAQDMSGKREIILKFAFEISFICPVLMTFNDVILYLCHRMLITCLNNEAQKQETFSQEGAFHL